MSSPSFPPTPGAGSTTGARRLLSVCGFFQCDSVYKFHVDWNMHLDVDDYGPFIRSPDELADPPGTVPSQGGNNLDTLASG